MSNNYDRFEFALVPLICLCIEVLIVCTATLIVFLSENNASDLKIASWHRECILSLLKDIYISAMFLLSLILCVIYIDTEDKSIAFRSIFIMTLPISILCITSLIKCVLIKSQRTILWCTLCLLVLAMIVELILKIDFYCDIGWITVLTPLMLVFVTLMGCAGESCIRRHRLGDAAGVFFSILVVLGCCAGIACMVFLEQSLVYDMKSIRFFKISGWVTIGLLGIGYSRKSGAWLLSVLLGHLEVDFWHFQHPVKTAELMSSRSKSV